jgi:hypothetical protein
MADVSILDRLKIRTVIRSIRRPTTAIWVTCSVAGGMGLISFVFIAWWQTSKMRMEMFMIAGEHAASALVVASVMGLTYEYYLHRIREKHESQRLTQAISQVSSVLPHTVFDLIADMAVRSPYVPTLFQPARASMREVVFLQNYEVLRQLLDLAAARNEEDAVLGWWFKTESDYRLKFLGSDIVGLFKRKHFAQLLAAEAELLIQRWDSLSERDKGWVMNYRWAASRCEEPMYSSLEQLLMTTPHSDIQQWILFIPQQMPHPTLSAMITRFMKERAHRNDPTSLQLVLGAMARLHVKTSQKKPLRRFGPVFKSVGLEAQYAQVAHVMERRVRADRRIAPRETPERRRPGVTGPAPLDLGRYDSLTAE